MRKQLQLVKYLKAVLFVTVERVFLAGSSLSNTQMGVVGGICHKKSGNAVIQNNRLTERGRWEGLWGSPPKPLLTAGLIPKVGRIVQSLFQACSEHLQD